MHSTAGNKIDKYSSTGGAGRRIAENGKILWCTALVEHLILLGISGGFCRNGIHFYTILLNAQPSGARAKIVPILDRFCVIAAGCTA